MTVLKPAENPTSWKEAMVLLPAYQAHVGFYHFPNGNHHVFGFASDGQWVCMGEVFEDTMEPRVFTHPDYRGRGLARDMAVFAQSKVGRVDVEAGSYTSDGMGYVKKMIEEGVCDE